MVSILLCGAGGKMGQVITQAVAQRSDCRIAAGIDPHAPACDYPVYASADQCTEPCDVIIDFSHQPPAAGCHLHHRTFRGAN